MTKKDVYLILFFFLLVLIYFLTPLIIFVFLIPLFLYLKETKKLNTKLISILIIISAILNFLYLFENYKSIIILSIVFYFFLIFPLIYFSKIIINSKFKLILIPSFFLIEFLLFSFLKIGNFWLNLTGFLNNFPELVKIIGSIGILFLIILFNVSLFEIIYFIIEMKKVKKSKKQKRLNKNYFVLNLIIIFFLILIFFIQPIFFPNIFYNKNLQNNLSTENKFIKVVGIQPNLVQDWDERMIYEKRNSNLIFNMSKFSIERYKPNIIVWPEYVFTEPIEFNQNLLNKIETFSKENNVTIIFGNLKLKNKNSNRSKRYDTLYVVNGDNIQSYNAYVPIRIFDDEVIPMKKNNPNIVIDNNSIGLSLCYEENFEKIFSKQIVEYNPKLFLIIGNEYYISSQRGLKLSSLNSKIRAVENNRFIFRLENGGLSQVINSNGNIVKTIIPNRKGILFYKIPLIKEKTFYSIHQKIIDFLIYLFSGITLIIFFIFQSPIKINFLCFIFFKK